MANTIDSVLEESKREVREKHKGENMRYVNGVIELAVIASSLAMAWIVVTTVDNSYTQLIVVPAVVWALYRSVVQFAK